jgi:3D-(3,5/4)-trihydroxycyclohexane-1,2-dione acylhydrolase (decyclizing)
VLVDNRGYASIGALSRSLGTDGFGTALTAEVDLAANAESLGARVVRAETLGDLRDGLEAAKSEAGVTVIVVATDRSRGVPSYESWWDVPVAEVSETATVRAARDQYEDARLAERRFL